MKSSEIATIILIVVISGAAAFFTVSSLWGNPSEKTRTVQVMEEIKNDFVEPSAEIFNKDAINPTTQVVIGQDDSKVNYGASNSDQKQEQTQNQQ